MLQEGRIHRCHPARVLSFRPQALNNCPWGTPQKVSSCSTQAIHCGSAWPRLCHVLRCRAGPITPGLSSLHAVARLKCGPSVLRRDDKGAICPCASCGIPELHLHQVSPDANRYVSGPRFTISASASRAPAVSRDGGGRCNLRPTLAAWPWTGRARRPPRLAWHRRLAAPP